MTGSQSQSTEGSTESKATTILDAALALNARCGWSLFPAPADGAKKSHKSKKHSNGRNWGATSDPNEIRRDFTRWPNANLGAPAGAENGFFVVEADTEEGHGIDGIATIRRLEAEYGPLPDTLMAISPSGSVHRYFKYPDKDDVAVINSQSKVGSGIDVIGEGGMVLLPPSMRPGKGQYRWLNDIEIAEAPQWLLDLITSKIRKRTTTHNGPLPEWLSVKEPEGLPPGTGRGFSDDPADVFEPTTPEKIKAALDVLDPRELGQDTMVAIAGALYHQCGNDKGHELLVHWLSKFEDYYDEDYCREQWQSIAAKNGYSYTIGSLFFFANQADPSWRKNYEQSKTESESEAGFRFEEDASESNPSQKHQRTHLNQRHQRILHKVIQSPKTTNPARATMQSRSSSSRWQSGPREIYRSPTSSWATG